MQDRIRPWLYPAIAIAMFLSLEACKKSEPESEPASVAQPAGKVRPTENPFLWRVRGDKPSYLYGTIHLPDDRVLALPKAVTRAIDGCDEMYTEIPMDPATQVAATPMMMLPEGKTLTDMLPEKLYARLDKLFSSKGLPLAGLSRLKVWVITVQAAMIDHIMDFATKQALDMVLYTRAQQAGKKVGGLETVEEQIGVFDGLTSGEQVRMLEQTLDLLAEFKAEGRAPVEYLLEAYLAGDDKKMVDAMLETYDPENELDKKLIKRLFTDRNATMSKRIAEKLEAGKGKSFFFAIGAGHLVGEEGMVKMLRARGLTIEPVRSE